MVNPHKAWQAKHYKSLLLACPFHFLGYLGWFYWTSSVSPKSARRFETQDNDSTFLFKHPSKKGVSKHHGNTKIPLQTNGSKTEAKFDMQSYLEEQLRNSSHWPEVQIPSWVFFLHVSFGRGAWNHRHHVPCQGTGLALRIFTPVFEVSFGPQPEKWKKIRKWQDVTFPENTVEKSLEKSLDISEPG